MIVPCVDSAGLHCLVIQPHGNPGVVVKGFCRWSSHLQSVDFK